MSSNLLSIVKARQAEKRAGLLAPVAHMMATEEEGEPLSTLTTPTTPVDLGTNLGLSVGMPWVLSQYGRGLFGPKMTLGESAAAGFGPRYVPMLGAFEALGALASPLTDPAYQSDRIGYLRSLQRGISRNIKQVGEASEDARNRYGLAGIPVQMFHGLMNPLHSTGYAAKEIGRYLMGKAGEDLALRAEASVHQALEASHAV